MSDASTPKPVGHWRKISDTVIEVNFDILSKFPTDEVKIKWNWTKMTGWVRVERIGEDLFVAGHKVILHREPEQIAGGTVTLTDLRHRLESKDVLDLRIMSALQENPNLIPRSWQKKETQKRADRIFFFSIGFHRRGSLCVCYFYGIEGHWYESYCWHGDCDDQDFVALLAD